MIRRLKEGCRLCCRLGETACYGALQKYHKNKLAVERSAASSSCQTCSKLQEMFTLKKTCIMNYELICVVVNADVLPFLPRSEEVVHPSDFSY